MAGDSERYLVLGGAGFLGSHIVEGLVDRGERSITVYDVQKPVRPDLIRGVNYVVGDICDRARLLDALKQVSSSDTTRTISVTQTVFGPS